jgi:hypothetical protein
MFVLSSALNTLLVSWAVDWKDFLFAASTLERHSAAM